MEADTSQACVDRRRRWTVAALGAIMLLATVLRCVKLDVSFYVEEILTHKGSILSWGECFTHRFYPIYYLLGRATTIVGDTEGLLRLPSVIAGVLAVPVLYSFGARVHSRTAGLLAALMLAVNPSHVLYSQEARYYGVVTLAVALMLWALDRAIEDGRLRYWVAYVLACNLGTGTHLTMYPVIGVTASAAVFALLVMHRGHPFRKRLKLIAILCICSAFGATVTVATATARGTAPTTFGMFDGDRADVVGDAKFDPGSLDRRSPYEVDTFRLTPRQYARYVQRLTGTGPWSRWLMLALCLIGGAALIRTRPHLASTLFAIVLVVPLPFLIRDVSHWYVPRYFVAVIPASLTLAACGMTTLMVQARRRVRRSAAQPLFGAAVVVAALCVLAPGAARGLQRHYATLPKVDWQGMADHMKPMLRPGDTVVTSGRRHLSAWLNHYFERDTHWYMGVRYRFRRRDAFSAMHLAEAMLDRPESNLWVITHGHDRRPEVEELLVRIADGRRRFGFATLWWRGAPSVNLASAAGFEGMAEGQSMGQFGCVTGADEAYEGARAIKLSVPPPEGRPRAATGVGDTPLRAVVRIPLSQDRSELRSGRFDAWRNSEPLGWCPLPEHASRVRPLEGMRMLERAAELPEADVESGLAQPLPLVAGTTVDLHARGLAEEPGALIMLLRYDVGPETRWFEVSHPGTGGWETMHLTVPVPEYVLPGSVAMEFRRPYGALGTVAVDDASYRVRGTPDSLPSGQPYVLSLSLRHDALEPNDTPFYTISTLGGEELHPRSGPGPVGQIALTGHSDEGTRFTHIVHHFGGTEDWHRLAFRIEDTTFLSEARDLAIEVAIAYTTSSKWIPPLNAEDRLCTEIVNLYEGSGTVWIDNVQFEAGERPTPLVRDVRPPHDEFLAALGPAP
ncbi:MAG: glycosyltransferase family 39 protein [bacterium]|nr:glycosyltransferase family 39 protein [bacterium]